ncbi:hypothetical protein GCM10020216_077260 [Nonomuraea helvata]
MHFEGRSRLPDVSPTGQATPVPQHPFGTLMPTGPRRSHFCLYSADALTVPVLLVIALISRQQLAPADNQASRRMQQATPSDCSGNPRSPPPTEFGFFPNTEGLGSTNGGQVTASERG